MPSREKEEARETRITMEIVVDCYDEAEQALGWFYYLEDALSFPFRAKCVARRSISPLRVGETVEVVGMAEEDECEREMFVSVRWRDDELAVPLSQLEPLSADPKTREAVEDWHYWVERGYQF